MYYGTREEKDNAVKTIIEEHRTAAGLFPAVRRVIERFDGKVYNVRFQTALQEETKRKIYTETRGNFVYIYIYAACGRQYTLAALQREDMADGKRINAAKMIESSREYRESHLKKAYKMEQDARRIDEIQKQVADIEKLLKSVVGGLDYQLRDIYSIPINLSRY